MSRLIPDIRNRIDDSNSSTTPLAGGATFTGSWVDITNYGVIYVNIYANVVSATDGLLIEQSSNGVNADHDDKFTIPAGTGKNFSINPYARYLRVSYTNGAGAQASFRLQTILKISGKPSTHRIQDSISTDDDAELVKAVVTGETPYGDFVNFAATRAGNLKVALQEYGDTPSIDAFDRLRTSQPFTIFDSKQIHDKQPLFYDETLGGAAGSTHSTANACVEMTVTAAATDYVIRETKQYFNYQPGKSQLILITFLATQQTGVTKRVGYFDGTGANYLTPKNGIFLSVTESVISWNIAKNGTTTQTVAQDAWNYDPLDGSGPSGVTLNLTYAQIIIIDFEWLGVGRVRVGFVIDGIIRYCHYFNHANKASYTSVYMTSPNLPIRYDIQSDGSGAGQLDHICSTVMSEGGLEQTGILRAIDTGVTHIDADAADTKYAVIGLRLKSGYYDITVIPEFFSMIAETSDDFKWTLELNPTIAGVFTYNDITNSACQYALGATANTVTSAGLIIDSGWSRAANSGDRKFVTSLRLGSTIAKVMDAIVLTVTPLTANADIQASLTFRELL